MKIELKTDVGHCSDCCSKYKVSLEADCLVNINPDMWRHNVPGVICIIHQPISLPKAQRRVSDTEFRIQNNLKRIHDHYLMHQAMEVLYPHKDLRDPIIPDLGIPVFQDGGIIDNPYTITIDDIHKMIDERNQATRKEVSKYLSKQIEQLDHDEKLDDIPIGTPLYLKNLSEHLNSQLIELRQWVGDDMNWNNSIDYMIEVLQASRMKPTQV